MIERIDEHGRQRLLRELTFALFLPKTATRQQIADAINDVSDPNRRRQLNSLFSRVQPAHRP